MTTRPALPCRAAPLGLALLAPALALRAQERPRPHVVLIVADDLGWTDLSTGRANGGHGSPYYATPHLDRLAAAGTCFTQAYSSAPNCAPTRAALWSGQCAARTGIYTVGRGDRGRAEHRRLDAAANATALRAGFVTLAERLRAAGYATGHFGKWHLGTDADGAGTGPRAQGFDHAVGGDERGAVRRGGHLAGPAGFDLPGLRPGDDDAAGVAPGAALTTALCDAAVRWLGATPRPSFCSIAHYAVHTPIEASRPALDATGPPPADSHHDHRTYAAMLRDLDDSVGRLVAWLEAADDPVWPGHKRVENTLIVFTSDNGGLGGYAAAGVEGGQEITDNRPLRSGKGALFEGGIRVPFLARWDGRVPEGAVDATPLQTLDLYPTLLRVAGVDLPDDLDGRDLSGRLQPRPEPVAERALFWHFPGYLQADARRGTWRTTPGAVIRRGPHKLIWWYETGTAQLFDLADDLGEDRDLAAARPELARALTAELRGWLEVTRAPLPRDATGAPVALPGR